MLKPLAEFTKSFIGKLPEWMEKSNCKPFIIVCVPRALTTTMFDPVLDWESNVVLPNESNTQEFGDVHR